MDETQSPIPFPCDFTIKIIGQSDKTFEGAVIKIFKKHYPKLKNIPYKKRLSRDAHYLALTITVYVDSKEALNAIYRDLNQCPNVIMAL